jgi:hypothetical protein
MSVSAELLCSFELLKPLDSSALKSHIKKGRSKRQQMLNSPVSCSYPTHVGDYANYSIARERPATECLDELSSFRGRFITTSVTLESVIRNGQPARYHSHVRQLKTDTSHRPSECRMQGHFGGGGLLRKGRQWGKASHPRRENRRSEVPVTLLRSRAGHDCPHPTFRNGRSAPRIHHIDSYLSRRKELFSVRQRGG